MSTKTGNVTHYEKDILPHINGPETLAGQVVTSQACITIFSIIQVCATLQNEEVDVVVKLAGSEIGTAVLSLTHPSITIGGGALGYKAEVTITLKTNPWALQICAKLCTPFSCKEGCTVLQL